MPISGEEGPLCTTLPEVAIKRGRWEKERDLVISRAAFADAASLSFLSSSGDDIVVACILRLVRYCRKIGGIFFCQRSRPIRRRRRMQEIEDGKDPGRRGL